MLPDTVHRLAQDAVTLFVVVDPIGCVPLYLAVTGGYSEERRRRTVLKAVGIAAVILLAFIVAGQEMLEALGISLASFRVAGGLVLLVIGLKMMLDDRSPAEAARADHGQDQEHYKDVAVFPLATPFLAGPGAIMAVVLLTDNTRFGVSEQLMTTLMLLGVLVVTALILLAATRVQDVLGDTGANVISRIEGLILAALAVEAIIHGASTAFHLG